MKIKSKLLTGYLLVAVSSVLVGFIGTLTTPQVKLAFDRLTTQTIPIIEAIEDVQFGGLRLVSSTSEYGFIIAEKAAATAAGEESDESGESGESDEVEAAKQQLNGAIKRYEYFVLTFFPDEAVFLKKIKISAQQLQQNADIVIDLKKRGISGREVLEAKELFEDSEKLFLNDVTDMLEHEHQELVLRSDQVNMAITTGNNTLWVASGLAILLALFMGNAVSGAISIPIDKLKKAAKSIGEGELDAKIDINNTDEIGELGLSFNKMVENLNESRAELANTQSQLVQSAKLASVGEMATGVAHELNQPLGIIALNSDLQIDEIGQGDFGEAQQTFELILKQVERATAIIDHLRTFGRESNNLSWTPTAVNVLIEDAFIMLNEQLRLCDIEVIKVLAEDLAPVNCNSIQIEQVLTNLIMNAKDAMQNTSVKQLTVTTRQLNDKVIIDVKDTGSGIAQDDISKVFDPFFTTKAVGKGTGLGLSISYGIIETHEGKLQVDSINQQGCVFSIELNSVKEAQI